MSQQPSSSRNAENQPVDPSGAGTDQREALKRSEEKASRTHPENFKDEENESKQVEIPPVQPDGSGIKGLDPEEE